VRFDECTMQTFPENPARLAGRLEKLRTPIRVDVYLDSADTPENIALSLGTVRELAGSRRVVSVIGCDRRSDREQRPAIARAALNASDLCILTSGGPGPDHPASGVMDMLRGVPHAPPERLKTIIDRPTAIHAAIREALPEGIVVLMGKRIQDTSQWHEDRRVATEVLHALHKPFIQSSITIPSLQFVHDAVSHRYGQPLFCYFFGSHALGRGDAASDIDVIVVLSKVDQAYRETFTANGFLLDVSVHDSETLHFMMRAEYDRGLAILSGKVDQSLVLPEPSALSSRLKEIARRMLESGPAPQTNWDTPRRYITAALSDLERCGDPDEQQMMAMDVFVKIIDIFMRCNRQFSGQDRYLIRSAKQFDAVFFEQARLALARVFEHGSVSSLMHLSRDVLNRIGGTLDAGYRQNYPKEFRLPLP
jgi:predicted nucleotidyltransferase